MIRSPLDRCEPEPVLHLLGEGLDAIVQHTRIPPTSLLERLLHPKGYDTVELPNAPTQDQRSARYQTAASLFDRCDTERRRLIGERVHHAWTCGRFHRFTRLRALLPLRRALKAVQA